MDQEKKTTQYPESVEETYQTGRTQPPKSHGGVFALLVGLVILLCGVTSALSLLNIRMFWELKTPEKKASEITLSFTRDTVPASTVPAPTSPEPAATPPSLQMILETMPRETLLPEPTEPVLPEELPPGETVPVLETVFPLEQVSEKIAGSLASIECVREDGTRFATGIVIAPNGYLLTECAPLTDASCIRVHLADQRCMDAVLIGKDEQMGVAVLHVPATDLCPVAFCDAAALAVGDQVAAFPSGSVAEVVQQLPGLLQTNVSAAAGEPLLNCFGQVVGISAGQMGMSQELSEALGFVIPTSALKERVEAIIRDYEPEEDPSLGLIAEAIPLFYQLYYELPEGLYITSVDDASDAFLKGISTGDILLSINGQPLDELNDLTQLIQDFSPGDTVSLVVYRSGEHYELNIQLGEE